MSGGFCTQCSHRVEKFQGLDACPVCGTRAIPCADRDQVTCSVNWHELRILVIWAENYARLQEGKPGAEKMVATVHAIARRIEDQHPDRALTTPLTFTGELRQLKDAFPTAEIFPPSLSESVEKFGRINDPPPPESPAR